VTVWLEQITLCDFRCFHGTQAIEFSQQPDKNITLIHAENGVGKTTLLNALLWCFYGQTTAKFERPDDLVNYDARQEGRTSAWVEVLFEHENNRYRARRYTKGASDREFSIMRVDGGHHQTLPNPDAFINTVIPRSMAGHFLFDGEHAEVFLGEDNRGSIRRAVQDILGCSLIKTAIVDLGETATYYRRQIPTTKASANMDAISSRIDALTTQISQAQMTREQILGEIEIIKQQIADIDDKLRNSTAAKQLQVRRDKATASLISAKRREAEAQDEVLRWLGDNGRYLVSTRITELGSDFLDQQEHKGRLPSPYNEEFVSDLLELERCICGAELKPGTEAHQAVASLLQKAANATLRSRISKVRAQLSLLRTERVRAPARLEAANRRLAEARNDISTHEADLNEVSELLAGINFDDIAVRESKRNELSREVGEKQRQVGTLDASISGSESQKATLERDLRKLADEDAGSRIFMRRYTLCETLKGRLEIELAEEEKSAKAVLRAAITKVLDKTSRKAFRLRMSDDYAISLVNEAGTQLPKSSGENQLLGLAFTAALVEYAKARQTAEDHRLLRGTVAPLVLDSPFGQLDEEYRKTTAEYVPEMAGQVVLMVSKTQAAGGVLEALGERIGEEYVLVRHNKDSRADRPVEVRQFNGKDIETAVFDAKFDGTSFHRVTR
jgi:DNA sulfur modification protein DndD